MGIPNLFTHIGWWGVWLPLIGLAAAFVFRRTRWSVLVWLPTTLLFVYLAGWLGLKLLAFSGVSGPDAIGVGIAFMVLIPSLAGALLGLVLCYFARPIKGAWHPVPAMIAALVCISLLFIGNREDGTVFTIILTDAQGAPLSGIGSNIKAIESGLSAGRRQLGSDQAGSLSFRVRKGQYGEVEFHAPVPHSGMLTHLPAWTTLRIEPEENGSRFLLRRFWQRSLGGGTLNEATAEIVPAEANIEHTIILPEQGSVGVPAMEQRVRASLLAGVDAGLVCRNTEAIACISLLIEAHRTGAPLTGTWNGLKQIASVLAELDAACRRMRRIARNPRQHNLDYIEGQFADEMKALSTWAGADTKASHLEILDQADAKISANVQLLTGLIVSELPQNDEMADIQRELRESGRRGVSQIVDALLLHPPVNGRSAERWGRALFPSSLQGRRIDNVKRLFDSNEPALIMVACEAMGNQLTSEGGAFALARLQSVRSRITDKDMAQRADMFIRHLQEDLARPPPAMQRGHADNRE